jgi:hypothetical protein
MVIVYGPPAAGVLIFAFHLPLLGACTESTVVFQEQAMVKRSLGSDQPHNVACEFCCNTILLLTIGGSRMMANSFEVKGTKVNEKHSRNTFFILQVLKAQFTNYMLSFVRSFQDSGVKDGVPVIF